MTESFAPLIETTTRAVSTRTRPEGLTRVVTISRTFATSIDDAWDALTNPERIPRWFNPISGDLQLGGHYQIENNASGVVERCDPPRFFAITWEYAGDVSWVEVTFSPMSDEATTITLEHIAIPGEHWAKFGPGAVGIGWDLAWLGLILHLEQPGVFDRANAMTWMMSEDGMASVTRSGAHWIEADIAGGEDEAQARKAGAATIAFFSGQ